MDVVIDETAYTLELNDAAAGTLVRMGLDLPGLHLRFAEGTQKATDGFAVFFACLEQAGWEGGMSGLLTAKADFDLNDVVRGLLAQSLDQAA